MKKVIVASLTLFLLTTPVIYAGPVVDAGNKICPVGGEEVSGKDFAEYQGKKYGLCCAMCAGKFSKNPEKYLAKMAESEKADHDGHGHPMQ